LLRKLHGVGTGKALPTLRRRVEGTAAAAGLFADYRPLFPNASPAAPVIPVVVDVWVDGSAGIEKGKGQDDKRDQTGVGIVVHDHRQSPGIIKELNAFTGTGSNNSAELAAIILALEYCAKEFGRTIMIRIHSDSDYARGLANHDQAKMHHRMVDKMRALIRDRNPRPIIAKSDAHTNSPENDVADRLAKEARISRRPPPPPDSFLASKAAPIVSTPRRPGFPPVRPPPIASVPVEEKKDDAPPPPPPPPPASPPSSTPPAPPMVYFPVSADEATLTSIRAAAAKVSLGYVGAAVDMLSRSPMPDLTENAIAHLESLHPKRDQSIDIKLLSITSYALCLHLSMKVLFAG
jgi:ribonuclease HI